jgi:hypothetical protein
VLLQGCLFDIWSLVLLQVITSLHSFSSTHNHKKDLKVVSKQGLRAKETAENPNWSKDLYPSFRTGCSSVVEGLFSISKALGLILSSAKGEKSKIKMQAIPFRNCFFYYNEFILKRNLL